jgi:hypothetical protein
MADFGDIFSRYAQRRFDQATQPFTDPAAYMSNRLGLPEDETQANVKPVTQTVTTDPTTGQQTMTVRGRPEDLTAANPYTPTVSGPAVPSFAPAVTPGRQANLGFQAQPEQFMPTMAPIAQPAMQQPAMQPPAMQPMGSGIQAPPSAFMPQPAMQPMQQPVPGPVAPTAPGPTTEQFAQALAQNQPPAMQPVAPRVAAVGYGMGQDEPGYGGAAEQPTAAPMGGTGLRMPAAAPAPAPAAAPTVTAAPVAAPVAPGAPPTAADGSAITRQAESGNNYSVGYNRAGTSDAYGPYQILGSTFEEIKRRDPYFANKKITELTPEDHDRANQVVRSMNAQGLINNKVEATEANLQLAHFLGAQGAAEYLRTGFISPEAAAANGGLAEADRIARERIRLGGGDPEAVTRTFVEGSATSPRQQALTASTNLINEAYTNKDQQALYRFAASTDPQIASPARDKIKLLDAEKSGADRADQLIAGNKTTELSRYLTSRDKDGSWIKYYLLTRLGLNDMAKEEAQLLGAGTKMTSLSDVSGNQYAAEVDGNGVIRKAWDSKGAAITSGDTIATLQASSLGKGERGLATGTRVRDTNNKEWSQVPTSRGMVFYDNAGNRGVPSGKTVPIGIGSDIQLQGQLQTQRKQIDLSYDPIIAAAKTGASGITEYNIKYGTNFSIAGTQAGGQPLIVDNNTGTVIRPNAQGVVTGTVATPAPGTTTAMGTTGPNIQRAEVTGQNLAAMNKDIQDNLVPDARKADSQVNSINEIFSILKDPGAERVFGVYNDVMSGTDARSKKILNDYIAGKIVAGSPEYEDFRRRISELGLNEDQLGVLRRLDALSAAGVGAAVRELTGTTGISNQDVKVAQRNNVSAGDWPMLAAYSQWNYQRFEGDLKRAKAEWAADNVDRFPNSAAMDKAWRQESAQLRKDAEAVSEARAKYLKGYNNLPNTQKAAKIKEAYELFPVPRYQSGEWANRKVRPLSSFVTN